MKIFKEYLTIIILSIFAGKFITIFELFDFTPDIIIIYLILRSLNSGAIYHAVVTGFIGGVIFDLISGYPPGLSSITYSISGFVAVIFSRERENFTKSEIYLLSLILISIHFIVRDLDLILTLSPYQSLLLITTPQILYTSIVQAVVTLFLPFEKKRRTA